MQIVQGQITSADLKRMASSMFGNLVKAVVDVKQGILAVDAELHADLEQKLLQEGSRQQNLWGINLHPDLIESDKFIEFDSMINLRPSQNNLSRDVQDQAIRAQITAIVKTKTKV